jgi:putative nucleotidyltransferase with HDIG domain
MTLFERIYQEALELESPINVRFKKQLDLISDQSKKTKVANLLRQVSYRNIQEPASSTGKYHPEYAHGEFGLSRHVKAVVAFISDICTAFEDLDRDTLIIAAIMHDILKYHNDDKYTSKTHAADAAKWLKENGLEDEGRLIASHMGKWDAKKGIAPAPEKFDEKMLHLADYLASKKWITIDFDNDDNVVEDPSTIQKDDPWIKGYEEGWSKGVNGENLF